LERLHDLITSIVICSNLHNSSRVWDIHCPVMMFLLNYFQNSWLVLKMAIVDQMSSHISITKIEGTSRIYLISFKPEWFFQSMFVIFEDNDEFVFIENWIPIKDSRFDSFAIFFILVTAYPISWNMIICHLDIVWITLSDIY